MDIAYHERIQSEGHFVSTAIRLLLSDIFFEKRVVPSGPPLGMSITVIIFLAYDFWYRTLTKAKPRHHPEKWPKELVIYVILLQLGSITLNGYGFLLSMQIGYLVLITYFISLFAFAYYQYKYKK